MPGSGKTTLANDLAKRYGLEIFTGSDVFKGMAREQGYDPDKIGWWESEEGFEFLAKRHENPKFDKEVDRVVMDVAKKGGVVITSWTMPYLGAPGIKIFLNASQEERAKRVVGRDGIDYEDALQHIKKRDEGNRRLYKNLYGFTLGQDLDIFDIIVDTDGMTPEQVDDIVAKQIDKMVK